MRCMERERYIRRDRVRRNRVRISTARKPLRTRLIFIGNHMHSIGHVWTRYICTKFLSKRTTNTTIPFARNKISNVGETFSKRGD